MLNRMECERSGNEVLVYLADLSLSIPVIRTGRGNQIPISVLPNGLALYVEPLTTLVAVYGRIRFINFKGTVSARKIHRSRI